MLVFQQKDSSDEPSQSDINPDSNVDDEDAGSSDEDSDDPDKLWCICQQPHNDRYSDWYNDWYSVTGTCGECWLTTNRPFQLVSLGCHGVTVEPL